MNTATPTTYKPSLSKAFIISEMSNTELYFHAIEENLTISDIDHLENLFLTYPPHLLRKMDLKDTKLSISESQWHKFQTCLELGIRSVNTSERVVFTRPVDVFSFINESLKGALQEHFIVLFLNAKNRLIEKQIISMGTRSEAVIDPVIIFKSAIEHNAHSIVLIHNHPSGDPTPSFQDIELTKRIGKGCKILGLILFDHIVIGDNSFKSLAETGLIEVY